MNIVIATIVGLVAEEVLRGQGAPGWVVSATCMVVLLLSLIWLELRDIKDKMR